MNNNDNIAKVNMLISMKPGTVLPIVENNICTYLAKSNDCYYVAIPYAGKDDIRQDFVGIKIITTTINYDGISSRVLSLCAKNEVKFNVFTPIAADFIDLKNRDRISMYPYEWIDDLRFTLGDAIKKSRVYDVIGELVALRECYKNDKTFVWEGANGGTHDLVSKNEIVEVKSSLNKTENIIHVNSSYQLISDKPLHLYFVRLESKPYSQTINSLVDDLVSLGYSKEELECSLSKHGYPIGDRFRNFSYDILEIVSYEINKETFPIVTIDEMNKFAPKNNIIGYELTLDLTSLHSDIVFSKK